MSSSSNSKPLTGSVIEIKTQTSGDEAIVEVTGKLLAGESCNAFVEKLQNLFAEGAKIILLNVAGISYVDSTGIGALISAYVSITKQGGKMKLLNMTERVRSLLAMTRLLPVLESQSNEAPPGQAEEKS